MFVESPLKRFDQLCDVRLIEEIVAKFQIDSRIQLTRKLGLSKIELVRICHRYFSRHGHGQELTEEDIHADPAEVIDVELFEARGGINTSVITRIKIDSAGADKKKWIEKAYKESLKDSTIVVCLVPARTNTNWWHTYCMKGEIRFICGRPKFKGAKHGLPQPLAIVIFGRAYKGGITKSFYLK